MNLSNKFLVFEEKHELFSLEIKDIEIWHFIRFDVYRKIMNQLENTVQAHDNLSKENLIKKLWLYFLQFPNYLFKNPNCNLNNRDILVLNHARRVWNGEHYDCIYTDEILSHINYSYYVFENPILGKHFKPVRTKNLRYLDIENLKIPIIKRLPRKIFHLNLSNEDRCKAEYIVGSINKTFDVNLEISDVIEVIELALINYKVYYRFYQKVLEKINPKTIIEVVSYSMDRLVLNVVAKEKGIPIIELQHGTMGKYHIAYNFLNKKNLTAFPDYVFLFGKFWKDTTRLPLDKSNLKVVGWPYYQKQVKKFNNQSKKNLKINILFVSQGLIGNYLSRIACELEEKLDLDQYKIIYKLHPGELLRWKKEYPWLLSSRIEIIENNAHSIHHYLSDADIQVGVSSTALFEGLGYGLKTIICKFPLYEYMEELINNQLVTLVENVDELLFQIEQENNTKKINSDYFWESYSNEKIDKFITDIVETPID